jgi:hypothetical protein
MLLFMVGKFKLLITGSETVFDLPMESGEQIIWLNGLNNARTIE